MTNRQETKLCRVFIAFVSMILLAASPPRALGQIPSLALAAFSSPLPHPVEPPPAPDPHAVPLYNGRDLSGWEAISAPPQAFLAQGPELVCTSRAQFPACLRTMQEYENFHVHLEYKCGKHSQFVLLLHAPLHGRASRVGIGIQLGDDIGPGAGAMPAGSIHGLTPPPFIATRWYHEWNSVDVLMDWPRLAVWINGRKLHDIDCDAHPVLRYRFRRGFIGLGGLGYRIHLRNLTIRELPSTEQGNWIELFNGRDLSGWQAVEKATWTVHDGVLHAMPDGGTGYLVSERQFQDFHLQLYMRTQPLANGGVFYRWRGLYPMDRGYEVQVLNVADSNNPTGSIYGHVRAHILTVTDGEWFPVQIIARGPRTEVRVNGEIAAIDENQQVVRCGHIALQMHHGPTGMEFKQIRIRPWDTPCGTPGRE